MFFKERLFVLVRCAPAYGLLWSVSALLLLDEDAAMLAFAFC